jgi:hypothetical protein
MNNEILEYLKSIKPGPHPKGIDVLKEGIEMGKAIKTQKSRFIRESGHKSFLEYKKQLLPGQGNPDRFPLQSWW